MAESHVVSGLVTKRSEMAGLIQHHQAEVSRISSNLHHLDATIKLFAPEFDLRTVRAKEHRARNQYFKPGECPKMTLDILRESGCALTSRQIATAMLQRKDMGQSVERVEQLQRNALGALKRLENKGLAEQGDPEGAARTWRIA